jgi:hypothetical protein
MFMQVNSKCAHHVRPPLPPGRWERVGETPLRAIRSARGYAGPKAAAFDTPCACRRIGEWLRANVLNTPSQRCAGSASSRGCRSKDTVNSGVETG